MRPLVRVSKDVVCCATISGDVPELCNFGSNSSKRVVLAQLPVAALWAACTTASAMHICLPLVQMTVRALMALPPDLMVSKL